MADTRRRLKLTRLRDNTVIIFPITPFPQFTWGMNVQSQDLLGVGEMDTGATPKLTTVNISNIILPHPDNHYEFAFSKNYPSFYLNYLWQFMKYQNNLLLEYYTSQTKIIHLNCRVVDIVGAGEKNGNKNIYIDNLKLKEYKDNKLSSMQFENVSQKAIDKYGSNIYYVKEGDNLINIAKNLYGDSSKWEVLMNKNGLSNPLAITVGMGLYI